MRQRREVRFTAETGSELAESPEPKPAPLHRQTRDDIVRVLERARIGDESVSIDVRLAGGSCLSATGTPRMVDATHVELIEGSGRTRRLPLRMVDSVRVVPPRMDRVLSRLKPVSEDEHELEEEDLP